MIDAVSIHARLGSDGWIRVLMKCGIAQEFLKDKHGPCPICGGKDRFRFDNRGKGTFICNQCRAGDGFKLIMGFCRLTFKDAFHRVLEIEGITPSQKIEPVKREPRALEIAEPTRRVKMLLKESCLVENCDAAVEYLASRSLWPLPEGHQLRAHPSVEYWHERQSIGRFPALLAAVRNGDSELVTAHVTYLTSEGAKIQNLEPRKMLSALTGHCGCAAQLMPANDIVGIAEGIETAFSATKLTGIPTWAALNATLLAKFEIGPDITKLVIFADRDVAGLEAALMLTQKMQDKVTTETRIPQVKDWNDVLAMQECEKREKAK